MSQTRPFEHVETEIVFGMYQDADKIDFTVGSMRATLNSSTADGVSLPVIHDLKALQLQAESVARCAALELERREFDFENRMLEDEH